MASDPRPRRRDDFQIAVICALPLEYDAVMFACDEIWNKGETRLANAPGDYNTYTIGRMGSHAVVLLLLPNMGKVSAASAAASLRSSYNGIRLAVLTGICGGVPGVGTRNEVFLGDVVISKSIVQYDLGRKYENHFEAENTMEESLGRASKGVRSLVATFETLHGRSHLQGRASQILAQVQGKAAAMGHLDLFSRPAAFEDTLFEPTYLHRHRDFDPCGCSESCACKPALVTSCEVLQCDHSHLVTRSRPLHQQADREIRVLVGRMGSADTVVKSGLDRDRVAREHNVIAFEMEGAGIWDEIPCIVVKAVCDYADSHKNKKWQHFAAATAASTTKALLEHYVHVEKPLALPSLFLVPYNENPNFIGRSETLDQIKRLFGHEQHEQHMSASTKPRSRVALYGLGGVGKTQIALAYVFWIRHTYPDISIFWVHASNAERFGQAYSSIAQECKIPGCDDPQADVLLLVKTWLENKSRGRWLMVIDNADDTRLFSPSHLECGMSDTSATNNGQGGLARHLPECGHVYILITSRNRQAACRLAPGKKPIHVGDMSNNESCQLLHQLLEDDISTGDASVLSARLEHLPLALAQAAAFIQENSVSVAKYIQLLDESDSSLVDQLSEPFEAVGRDSETPHALVATWIVSFNQIHKQDALASDILSLASLLDRQGIPESLITGFCDQWTMNGQGIGKKEMLKALGILKAFSFVSQDEDNAIEMHRLVQLVTRKWLQTQNRLSGCIRGALEIVSHLYPFGRYGSREICQKYHPHAHAVLRHNQGSLLDERLARASLLHNMAGYFLYCGQWLRAEQSLSQSAKERHEILGEEHPDTLSSMAALASAISNQGRWKEAEELEARVLGTKKRVLGEDHPSTLTSMHNLASTFWFQGRWMETEELELRGIETMKRMLGAEHPDTLTSMASIASSFWNQGRWREAEELGIQVIEMRKKVLGEDHPSTLRSMYNLAVICKHTERRQDAMQLLQDCVRRREKILGADHPDTIFSASSLSGWTRELESTGHNSW